MADTFRQFPFPIQTFSRTHFFRIFFNFIYKRLHFLHASCRILRHSLTQLLHAEFHVMKIRDGFTQFLGKVGQHGFKLTKLHTHQIRRFRSYCFQCLRLRNERAHTPVTFSIKIICLSFGSRYKTKYLAIYIRFMNLFQFLTNMTGHTLNIMLKKCYILKYLMIDTLQYIVASLRICSLNFISLINQTGCQRNYFFHLSNLRELCNNFIK